MTSQGRGFTTVELLAVIGILAIVGAIVALNLRPLSNHAQNGANAIAAGLKQARARAMSTTSAYRLVYASETELHAESAPNCGSTSWTRDATFDVTLEDSARLEVEGVSIGSSITCYSSRGFAESSRMLKVSDDRGSSRTVEVFVGGGVVVE